MGVNPAESPRPLQLAEGTQYVESPFEAAFATLIADRFQASLDKPKVIEDLDSLIRSSQAVPIEGTNAVAVFQYTRLDPMAGSTIAVVDAYKHANPSEGLLPPYAEIDDVDAINREVNTLWQDIRDKKRQEEAGRSGAIDRTLTDPEYYAPGVPLVQPAEEFEFALFTGPRKPESTDEVKPIVHGAVGDIRADFHGTLSLDPRFEDVAPSSQHQDLFYISNPAFEYITDRAAVIVLSDNYDPDPSEDVILDKALDIYTEGSVKGFQANIDFDDPFPSEVMDNLGNYIYVLAAGK